MYERACLCVSVCARLSVCPGVSVFVGEYAQMYLCLCSMSVCVRGMVCARDSVNV